MKKKLFRKVATIVAATVLGTVTIMGSTVASAMQRSSSYDCNVKDVCASVKGQSGSLDKNVEKQLASAFDKITIYEDDVYVRYTVNVKDFKILDDQDAYISKISSTKKTYENIEDAENYKEEDVDYKVVEKDKNCHPTAYEISYKLENEWIIAGFFDIEVTCGVEKATYTVELEVDSPFSDEKEEAAKSGEQKENVKAEDKKEVANNTSDKKTQETVKPTEAPTATPAPTTAPTKKPEASKDKTPKTADENSTAVMISMILGSVSVVSLAGIYVYKRKKNNI